METFKCLSCQASLPHPFGAADSPLPYGSEETLLFTCPYCGAKNKLRLAEIQSEQSEEKFVPATPDEMRTAIIDILKRLYPGRTGYNGGHLAPVRDPNPELFFAVLSELEKERIIEYNDTQVALRLSPIFIENRGEL